MILTSCEGYVRLTGKVVDDTNDHGIKDVKIELLDVPPIERFDPATNTYIDSVFVSDDKGLFKVQSRMIGMVKSPKYRIRFSKDGFQTSEIFMSRDSAANYWSAKDSLYIIKLKRASAP